MLAPFFIDIMTIYFASDFHFNHSRIIDYTNRPFKNIKEMNLSLFHLWNETVGKDDTIYYLGDFAFGPESDLLKIIKGLNGKKYFLPGNHDHHFNKWLEQGKITFDDFELILPIKDLKLSRDERFMLCHYPMESWNAKTYGCIHLHGHRHSKTPITGDNRIDVGFDAWHKIPSLDDIRNLLKENESSNADCEDWSIKIPKPPDNTYKPMF